MKILKTPPNRIVPSVNPTRLFLEAACCEASVSRGDGVSAVGGGGGDGGRQWGEGRLAITVCNLVSVINVGSAAPAPHNYGFIPPLPPELCKGPLTPEDCD